MRYGFGIEMISRFRNPFFRKLAQFVFIDLHITLLRHHIGPNILNTDARLLYREQ